MSEIRVIEKSSDISFDKIHEILWEANRINRERGFILKTSNLSGEELEKRIGQDGKCFVALDGDKLVGTISVKFINRNTWYAKGKIPEYCLAGILPEYQGKKIYSLLVKELNAYVKKNNYPLIELDTAEDNYNAIEIYKHQGFQLVDFSSKKGLDHYSVIMAKWVDKCPYSNAYRSFRYNIKKILVKIRYKKGKIKRFGL